MEKSFDIFLSHNSQDKAIIHELHQLLADRSINAWLDEEKLPPGQNWLPLADKVKLVMDNLNTHTTASLYKVLELVEARRLAERLEIHYTPKHGS